MPNIKSAKKRAIKSEETRQANRTKRSALRSAIKKAFASLDGDRAEARANMQAAVKKLDQAAAAGLIHKNTAARRKSRLAKKVNAMGA